MDASLCISLIDLTSLNENDSETSITALCDKAQTPLGNVAAVCLYLPFVSLAKSLLKNSHIKIATVVNFPNGDLNLNATLKEIEEAILLGVDEIDLVFPYESYFSGEKAAALSFVKSCREACKTKTLKVILETGAFPNDMLIAEVSRSLIDLNVDFLKTSTGKIALGATENAATSMLKAIKDSGNKKVGFKASGGIRQAKDALKYLLIAEKLLGKNWINPSHFRFGASSLLNDILGEKK
jgi:deoxyribose-phosphate aldolase